VVNSFQDKIGERDFVGEDIEASEKAEVGVEVGLEVVGRGVFAWHVFSETHKILLLIKQPSQRA
jgi:hypothetical protein